MTGRVYVENEIRSIKSKFSVSIDGHMPIVKVNLWTEVRTDGRRVGWAGCRDGLCGRVRRPGAMVWLMTGDVPGRSFSWKLPLLITPIVAAGDCWILFCRGTAPKNGDGWGGGATRNPLPPPRGLAMTGWLPIQPCSRLKKNTFFFTNISKIRLV